MGRHGLAVVLSPTVLSVSSGEEETGETGMYYKQDPTVLSISFFSF